MNFTIVGTTPVFELAIQWDADGFPIPAALQRRLVLQGLTGGIGNAEGEFLSQCGACVERDGITGWDIDFDELDDIRRGLGAGVGEIKMRNTDGRTVRVFGNGE